MVLAGGMSRRFGCDKCSFRINGKTMLDRLVSELDPLIVTRHKRGYKREVVEEGEYGGPLKGVKEGVKHVRGEKVFITGCDYPFLTFRVVSSMCEKNYKVVSFYDGKVQPLLSCYSVSYLRDAIRKASRLSDLVTLSDEIYYVGYYEMKMYDPLLASIQDYDSITTHTKLRFSNSLVVIK
ncbi:Molybdenum cofactor guanylyltransferase [Sulfuracidifex tepidarius]|uniref:Molybdenum cofactor guanylyltransferase n=2 Tax=Sulfuracidifex tepidarius TaxID=1294262 RepID=A0A510DV39_9CREN|nr:Molybdenum cofactor guanylyltransferase [Sulfuracidifex tepidarius]BBG26848.1 Molybdenum cofactor guanylyltransferase [Sulfuracidifex tepidarius]